MERKKYVVTAWIEEFDIDGLTNEFSIFGIFEDCERAIACANIEIGVCISKKIGSDRSDWSSARNDEVRLPFESPNKLNKVVYSTAGSNKDRSGYNAIYVFIDVIEVDQETKIEEQLFGRSMEVSRYFDSRPATWSGTRAELWNLKQNRRKPTQCHLWQLEDLTAEDLNSAFQVRRTFSDDDHFSRRLVQCMNCEQLYLFEFYEEIDWIDNEDPQYVTYIPVDNEQEAEAINQVGLWELQTFQPRLNKDWPKKKPMTIHWIGK